MVRKDKKSLNMPNIKGGHSVTSIFYKKWQFNILSEKNNVCDGDSHLHYEDILLKSQV